VVLIMGAVALVVDEHQEYVIANRASHGAWARAVDVTAPPTNIWLVITGARGERQVTPNAPSAVRSLDPRALADGPTRLQRNGRELVVWTGGRPSGRVSAVYDLTPREQAENRLELSLGVGAVVSIAAAATIGGTIARRAVRPLSAALTRQRRFVADASHELRTPLAVLMLRAEMLGRRPPGVVDAELTAELTGLVQDAKAMGEVVDDLLLAAELEHRPQQGETVHLWAVASEVANRLRPLAEQRSVTLTAVCLDGPTERQPVDAVNGRPGALRRAIASLVDNALAHTPPGGRIVVEVGRRPDQVTVCVRDNGHGLDPAQAQRLVEPFARGTSSGQGRRFGLGLALVAEVARAHGGRLEVDGEPGRGAAFTLVLPGS
jgi:signal transduction histidine kinase